MANPMGKAKLKAALKELGCATEFEAWEKALPLDDDGARRIDQLADEYEGIPRLRVLGDYLLLDAGDGENIHVFKDTRGTRREIVGQILATLPKVEQGEDGSDIDDDPSDKNYPDEEPDYESEDGRPVRHEQERATKPSRMRPR